MKRRLGYDDSLDAFGVHGVGGFIGSVLTGVFCVRRARRLGVDLDRPPARRPAPRVRRDRGVVGRGDLGAFALADAVLGARVDEEQEMIGLDLTNHEERGTISGDRGAALAPAPTSRPIEQVHHERLAPAGDSASQPGAARGLSARPRGRRRRRR